MRPLASTGLLGTGGVDADDEGLLEGDLLELDLRELDRTGVDSLQSNKYWSVIKSSLTSRHINM